ncbi:hypothetical protein GCM10022393_04060 [Aquimarina addita]|uniref:Outer membrane protein beta-barrel domain-containing protein n=2 Tax=Aquimarina addita TaxID=870485 RepID=A0ABP7X9G5_9FLAO
MVAQVTIDQILESGVDDARRFSQDYFAPAGEGVVNAMSNGWYNTATVKELFDFEIGIVGNASFVRDDKKAFFLREDDYDNLVFRDSENGVIQSVATVFGENAEDVVMIVGEGGAGQGEILLPDGLGGTGVNTIPTVFLQASVGLVKGTEIKARFWPKLSGGNTESFLYGVGIQHELTKSIFSWKRSPVSISGILGFSKLRATYDFSEDSTLEGEGQEIEFEGNSWLISGIVSTKFPVFNFYGGFGYYSGETTTDLNGSYEVSGGAVTLEDPVTVDHKESGLKATFGTIVAVSFFKVNLDYTLQNYSTLSMGLHVGF